MLGVGLLWQVRCDGLPGAAEVRDISRPWPRLNGGVGRGPPTIGATTSCPRTGPPTTIRRSTASAPAGAAGWRGRLSSPIWHSRRPGREEPACPRSTWRPIAGTPPKHAMAPRWGSCSAGSPLATTTRPTPPPAVQSNLRVRPTPSPSTVSCASLARRGMGCKLQPLLVAHTCTPRREETPASQRCPIRCNKDCL